MSNRIIRNLPDSKYKAVVGNTLAGGSNPFGTESEITDQVTESEIVNGLNVGINNTNVDAAYIATDGIYRMPTKTEGDELINNCTWTWSTQNGVNGYTVEGNGNSIFIPASGYRNGASLLNDGTEGYLWTDTFIDEWTFMVMFSSSQHYTNGSTSRYNGRTIRPVSSIEGVDLGLPSGLKWASVNIGATLPEDYGDYFAWAETETKESFTSENYICPSGSEGTELDPVTHVTKYSLVNILHKNNPNIHTSPEKEARWDGKQDALGFTPENSANKKTSLAENSDTYYPTQKAVKTAVDVKVTGAASSTVGYIAVADDTSGKSIKYVPVTVDDSGNVVISGNATINGTLTTINSETLQVKDKNIEIAKVDTPTDDTADGGGITLLGATNKTITWVKSKLSWVFNQAVEIAGNLNVIGIIKTNGSQISTSDLSDGSNLVKNTASSTDNAIARFDGDTGKLVQNSGAYIDDSGKVGIGITGPSEKLHVIGNTLASGDSASSTKTIGGKVRMAYDSATNTLKFNFL